MIRRSPLARAALLATTLALACTACTGDNGNDDSDKPDCAYHSDCPNSGVCYKGKCSGTASCFERKNCENIPICADQKCICSEEINRCLPVCVTDNDCSAEGQCVDGVCTPYPERWSGMPWPSGDRGQLQVGIGRVDLDFPMGVSMAGYASRRGPRTPYQDSLGGSNAWFGRPDVRAIAFDDGKEMFVMLRIPTGWSTDEMLTATARKVQDRIAINLSEKILTTAPHSHAHPARHWHLVKGYGFGFFGYDEYGFEIFDRLTSSFADAVVLAVENMQPAKFGYLVLDDFDPQNRIHRDRRPENNGLPTTIGKDGRMILMRVDDLNDQPLAVLTNFGIHGTVFDYDNPIMTQDAPGGVETILTERASAKYGRPVLGVFIQGNAGDISPSGDFAGHRDMEQMQVVGKLAWETMDAKLDEISTSASTQVGFASGRVVITHEALGYQPNEFYDTDVECEGTPGYFRYGAFQCVEGGFDDEDPNTKFTDGDLNCVFSVECLTSGFPVPQFQKTSLAVARLGTLAMATMPGEPLSTFGRSLSDRILQAMPGIEAATTLGYAQDHHFYLLTEDDWLQGGYEPSRDIWGWRFGPYLIEKSVELAEDLAREPEDRIFDSGNLKGMIWTDPAEELTYVEPTDTEGPPDEVLTEVDATVERMSVVRFAWRGGHPGIDLPRITLQIDRGSGFETYKKPGDLDYDDLGFEMLVHYDGTCNKTNCTQHAWRVDWEERRDFPPGRYRLHAEGHAQQNGELMPYSVSSRAFDLVPTTKLRIYDLRVTNDAIEGRVTDPAIVAFKPDGNRQVADERAGHLLHSIDVPAYLGAPLPAGTTLTASGTIKRSGAIDVSLDGTTASLETIVELRRRVVAIDENGQPEWRDSGMQPTTKFTMLGPTLDQPGDYLVTLTLIDDLGNSGTITATITR